MRASGPCLSFACGFAVIPLAACAVRAGQPAVRPVYYAMQSNPQPPKPKTKQTSQNPLPRPQPRPPQTPQLPGGSGDPIPAAASIYLRPGVAIGGLSGAVWADINNDGVTDGYVYDGHYYAGAPAGYDLTLGHVASGAAMDALTGVAVVPGAVIGSATGGLPGAVWADRNGDGVVDGYIYNGQYYQGLPPSSQPIPVPVPADTGERG